MGGHFKKVDPAVRNCCMVRAGKRRNEILTIEMILAHVQSVFWILIIRRTEAKQVYEKLMLQTLKQRRIRR